VGGRGLLPACPTGGMGALVFWPCCWLQAGRGGPIARSLIQPAAPAPPRVVEGRLDGRPWPHCSMQAGPPYLVRPCPRAGRLCMLPTRPKGWVGTFALRLLPRQLQVGAGQVTPTSGHLEILSLSRCQAFGMYNCVTAAPPHCRQGPFPADVWAEPGCPACWAAPAPDAPLQAVGLARPNCWAGGALRPSIRGNGSGSAGCHPPPCRRRGPVPSHQSGGVL
jgi:hypothetical protein